MDFGTFLVKLLKGVWSTKYVDISLFNLGNLDLSAKVSGKGVNLSAMVSAISSGITIKLGFIDITLSADIGAVGAKLKLDNEGFHLGFAYLFGGSIDISLKN